MFHREITGNVSVNLDGVFLSPEKMREIFAWHMEGKQAAVIEGVMGYYDGQGSSDRASSYDAVSYTHLDVYKRQGHHLCAGRDDAENRNMSIQLISVSHKTADLSIRSCFARTRESHQREIFSVAETLLFQYLELPAAIDGAESVSYTHLDVYKRQDQLSLFDPRDPFTGSK